MKVFKSKENIEELDDELNNKNEETNVDEEDEKIDYTTIGPVVERVTHGLVGSLKIISKTNSPLFKPNDIAHIRQTNHFVIGDFILYNSHDEYFLRRIMKIKEDNAYVAGDNEKEYRIVNRKEIIGKVIGRERGLKYLSFTLNKKKKIYTFNKVNLAYFRLKNRVLNYEDEVNNESLELAQQKALENQQLKQNEKQEYENVSKMAVNIDLDSELKDFIDPDQLVDELMNAGSETEDDADIENEEIYEEQDAEDTSDESSEEFDDGISSDDAQDVQTSEESDDEISDDNLKNENSNEANGSNDNSNLSKK